MLAATSPSCLRVERLSAGFQARVVLREISLEVPARGILGIMGPAGVGKSTFLRTLARWNEPLPTFWVEGDIRVEDASLLRDLPLEQAQRWVALLAQKSRLFTARTVDNAIAEIRPPNPISRAAKRELAFQALAPLSLWDEFEPLLDEPGLELSIGQQRRLSIARLVAGGARCLLADEPLRDVPDDEAARIQALLRRIGEERALVVVTHHQGQARDLCDAIALLVDGSLVEIDDAESFFSRPRTPLGREYVRLGNCWPRARDPEPKAEASRALRGIHLPSGFHWLIPGLLGGMQRPGLMQDLAEDLAGLTAVSCQRLVNLTDQPSDRAGLRALGIECLDLPIVDMGIPTLETAERLCREISAWVDDGLPTVVHCKAGLGRTGTILACVLVLRGENAVRAVHRVRAANPHAIQTAEQLAFVGELAEMLENRSRESPA